MSSKSRRRAQRKAERVKKQIRRWSRIPADLYPFEKLHQFAEYKSAEETQAIVEQQQYLPWPIVKERHPCRPFHPEDLWEIGALKKAILNEVYGLPIVSTKYPHHGLEKCHHAQYCLCHILRCWRENIFRYDSAGPSFLIHSLKHRCNDMLGLESLTERDEAVVETMRAAARKTGFHVILGRLQRSLAVVSGAQKYDTGESCVKYELCDLVHDGGQLVTIYPRVSEIDLLDEWSFEGVEADELDTQGRAVWHRTVLIVVPNNFIDEFIMPTMEESDPGEDIEEADITMETSSESSKEDKLFSTAREEEFECIDEETMIEIAHRVETCGRELAEVHAAYPEDGSDVEVEDEAGNKYFMPAAFFNS